MKLLLARIGLIGFGILVALVIAEIGFRILYPDPKPKLTNYLQPHEIYGQALRPNTQGWHTSIRGEYSAYVKINGKGIRDRDYAYDKSGPSFRILILGDSFTTAQQIADDAMFSNLLDQALNDNQPGRFEVINSGVPGYSTGNQLAYYTHEGYKYQSDLVILAFFTGNDIFENINPPHYKFQDDDLVLANADYGHNFEATLVDDGSTFRKIRNFLFTHSRLYSVSLELLIFASIQQSPLLLSWFVDSGFVEVNRPILNEGLIFPRFQTTEEAWEMTEALLIKLNREVQNNDSRLLVMIIPDETEVDKIKRDRVLAAYPVLAKQTESLNPSIRLGKFLQQEGIMVLSLTSIFEDYQSDANLIYFPHDGHFTPLGHILTSRAMFEYITRLGP